MAKEGKQEAGGPAVDKQKNERMGECVRMPCVYWITLSLFFCNCTMTSVWTWDDDSGGAEDGDEEAEEEKVEKGCLGSWRLTG